MLDDYFKLVVLNNFMPDFPVILLKERIYCVLVYSWKFLAHPCN